MEFNYALLVKYLIGSLSSEEMEEVMRWRDLSAENETVFSEVLRLRLSWNTAKYADNERIDMALEKVNARINRARRYRIARSLLKYAAVVQTGADAKFFISEGLVLVDGEVETRRGRKIYDGMTVKILADEEVNLNVKKR